MQRIPSIWVCFTTQGVIQNGSVFRYQTHTSGHFYIGVAPGGLDPPVCGVSQVTMWPYKALQECLFLPKYTDDKRWEWDLTLRSWSLEERKLFLSCIVVLID